MFGSPPGLPSLPLPLSLPPVWTFSDGLSAPGRDLNYALTAPGQERLAHMGVALPPPSRGGQISLRYCVDWTEQRHHMSGVVGRALLARLLELGWVERDKRTRAVRVPAPGRRQLRSAFGAAVVD